LPSTDSGDEGRPSLDLAEDRFSDDPDDEEDVFEIQQNLAKG